MAYEKKGIHRLGAASEGSDVLIFRLALGRVTIECRLLVGPKDITLVVDVVR